MATEITVLDFKLSNTFSEYCTHMNAPEQQAMFKEMGVKTFYIGECIEALKEQMLCLKDQRMFYITFLSVRKQSLLLRPLVIFMKKPKSQDG